MKNLVRFLAFSALILFSLDQARADVFMRQKEHSDAMTIMGKTQPAKDQVTSIWMTSDKVRTDNDETSVIMRMDKSAIYILQHKQKVYMELPINFAAAAAGESVPDLGIKLTVTAASEKKKIQQWNCQKYNMKMEMGGMGFSIDNEIWATLDLKIDPAVYAKFTSAAMAANPMLAASMSQMVEEMKKIQGVHVLTNSAVQMMGQTMKSTNELIEFKQGKAPEGIFELPEGYKKQSMMGGMN